MKIEIGERYVNKTWRFLMPTLKGFGDTFIMKFNPVFKLAVGIHDTLLDGSVFSDGRNIYILCDKLVQEKAYNDFYNWVKFEPYFRTDYCPESNITKSRKHMIVLEIPEIFHGAYDKFVKSEYSNMYSKEHIQILFSSSERKADFDILMKSGNAYDNLIRNANKEFGTTVTSFNEYPEHLELPLKASEEVFNCEVGQNVYFTKEISKVIEIT